MKTMNMMVAMVIMVLSVNGANAGNIYLDVAPSTGSIFYDGKGGTLTGVDFTVSSMTYLDDHNNAIGNPITIYDGSLTFQTGPLLFGSRDVLIFDTGGNLTVNGSVDPSTLSTPLFVGSFTGDPGNSGNPVVQRWGANDQNLDVFTALISGVAWTGNVSLSFYAPQINQGIDTIGTNNNGGHVIINVIPEPNSFTLMGLGIVVFGIVGVSSKRLDKNHENQTRAGR